jgi:hypothetical protein
MNPRRRRDQFPCATLPLLIVLVLFSPAEGDIIMPIGPFSGDVTEGFESFSQGAHSSLSVFGGRAEINNLTPGGGLKIEFSSALNGNLVTPRTGAKMGGQLGIAEWVFDEPPAQFGGYFETNSGADDGVVTFFDAQNQIVGQDILRAVNVGRIWTWNGWAFAEPIQRLVIDGNGLIDGFIWYDDMQLISIPEPATGAIAVVSWMLMGAFGRRRPQRDRPVAFAERRRLTH